MGVGVGVGGGLCGGHDCARGCGGQGGGVSIRRRRSLLPRRMSVQILALGGLDRGAVVSARVCVCVCVGRRRARRDGCAPALVLRATRFRVLGGGGGAGDGLREGHRARHDGPLWGVVLLGRGRTREVRGGREAGVERGGGGCGALRGLLRQDIARGGGGCEGRGSFAEEESHVQRGRKDEGKDEREEGDEEITHAAGRRRSPTLVARQGPSAVPSGPRTSLFLVVPTGPSPSFPRTRVLRPSAPAPRRGPVGHSVVVHLGAEEANNSKLQPSTRTAPHPRVRRSQPCVRRRHQQAF